MLSTVETPRVCEALLARMQSRSLLEVLSVNWLEKMKMQVVNRMST